MKKMKMKSSTIEPARPSEQSLSSRATTGIADSNGKNKSVWQTMVDNAGFARRHPNLMLKRKK